MPFQQVRGIESWCPRREFKPPSDTDCEPTGFSEVLVEIHLNQHFLLSRMIGQDQPEPQVQIGAFGGFGVGEDGEEVAVGPDEGGDVVTGGLAAARELGGAKLGFGSGAGG
ncbi:hypothetical protein [Kitasatospora sp. GP82]|uniref:hypothetical protein n=1 Tax=Kitasatospora sp. GP82 TaxID=3035089 RepID=UPI002475CF60|nr:hypothetical protein [Kitasatospora sp. GP82]MDH6130428.1 hypothetical protein [Kitasatospora sp. GP82]